MRFYLALIIAKTSNFIINLFRIGSGFTWPGHLALKIYPNILSNKRFNFSKGVILISGTNGKTTTSKLITHLLTASGYKVVHNKTGANLLNGIVSEILLNMDILGRHNSDFGVFEVDENNLPIVLKYIDPNVLVLLNLSRDQLDRYGETDIIFEKWIDEIKNLKGDVEIVCDDSQKEFKQLPNVFKGELTYFDDSKDFLKHTSLLGSFNAKNVNASVYSAMLVGLSEEEIIQNLHSFTYAYGRGELIEKNDTSFKILLAKNPASFNYNLDTILVDEIEGDTLLFILNDKIPDGRDISWIYDIESDLLNKVCEDKNIVVSGTRAHDMGVRLLYADVLVSRENIQQDLDKALSIVKDLGNSCIVLPNYSSMLDIRQKLTGKKIL